MSATIIFGAQQVHQVNEIFKLNVTEPQKYLFFDCVPLIVCVCVSLSRFLLGYFTLH